MGKQTSQLRFCLIGEDHLLLQCANFLIEKSYKVVAIFSDYYNVNEWCRKYGVLNYASHEINQINSTVGEFDYLLSISNPHILSTEVLIAPHIMAVNYHNALLPNYAGSNATSWAILNNEITHGITWHVMTADIDEGPILYQQTLPILKDDTAISLNIRCHQLAQSTFADFIERLVNDKLVPQKNSVHTKHKASDKPKHNGFIHWEMSAALIYRIFRGLTLGTYVNTLATPKLVFKQQIFIIEDMELTNQTSGKEAGSILKVDDDGLWIHTSTTAIKLKKIRFFSGKPIAITEFLSLYGLTIGDSLLNQENEIEQFATISKRYAHAENFWVSEWKHCFPLLLFTQNSSNELNSKSSKQNLEYNKIEELFFKNLAKHQIENKPLWSTQLFLVTAITIYLYRQNQYRPISFLLHKDILVNLLLSFENHVEDSNVQILNSILYEDYYLINIELSPDFTYEKVVQLLVDKFKLLSQRGLYLKDCFVRYPDLEKRVISDLVCITPFESQNQSQMTKEYWEQNNKPAPLITFYLSKQENRLGISTQISKAHCDIEYNILIKKHLTALINSLQRKIHYKIHELSLLSEEEKNLLSTELNEQDGSKKKQESLLSLFREQVRKYPSKIAVQDNHQAITYQELDKQSDALAYHFSHYNPPPSSGICFLMAANVKAVITVLAILKQHCYYVPIPEGYSADLIHKVIKENDSTLLIVNSKNRLVDLKNAENLGEEKFNVIDIENLSLSTPVPNTNNSRENADSLAYVMYTSGSTGAAKGVMIRQSSVINLIKDQSAFKINALDNIGHSSSMAFDASTFLMWSALLNGATLTMIDKTILIDDRKFFLFLQNYKINILLLPVRLFDRFVDKNCAMLSALKVLIVGGDIMTLSTTNKAIKYFKKTDCLLINAYGPTENTTATTFYRIDKQKKHHYRIPIGKPLHNVSVYILDKFYNPLPIGMIGELYIGGESLSPGYVKNKALTQKKFLKNIANLKNNNTPVYYQTGDLVYWSSNGNLEYIGRTDSQVKIRGYRIDLNVLTLSLLKHPLVKEACITIEVKNNIKEMVAYLLPKSFEDTHHIKALLWSYIKEELPSFMWPQHIMLVKKMPLNKSGKVDTKKLIYEKYGDQNGIVNTSSCSIPNSVSHDLFKIWREVLGHSEFGEEDNFFNIGGHSLNLAIALMEIEKKLLIQLSVTDFLSSPTIKQLSVLIKASKKKNNKNKNQRNIEKIIKNDLDYEIVSRKQLSKKETKKALITGVTGFLGKYLLKTLLKQTHYNFYCLVRNAKQFSLQSFLLGLFSKDSLDESYYNRVHIISGDLSKPQLGMNANDFELITKEVDTIYHVATFVNHLYDYVTLSPVNVEATKQIIQLANTEILKKIIYISSLSAAVLTKENIITEKLPDCRDNVRKIPDGYSQTKWVSEYLLNKARKIGISIKVIRPGWILGDEESGEMPHENHLLALVDSCIQLGVAPNWDCRLRFLPVNFVADAIIKIADDNMNHCCYNLTHPYGIAWNELVQFLNKNGHPIDLISVNDWVDNYISCLPQDNALTPFSFLYRNKQQSRINGPDIPYPIYQTNTLTRLGATHLSFPKINESVLQQFFLHRIMSNVKVTE